MPPSLPDAPAPSPHCARLANILRGETRGWSSRDLLALKALFHLQRRLELVQRRPDAPFRAVADCVRTAAATFAALLAGRARNPWFDTIAADIALDPSFSEGTEARLRVWLAACPAQRDGDGIVMIIPTLAAGGAEGQMTRLASALAAENVPVTVLVKHAGEARFDFHHEALVKAGVRVSEIGAYGDNDASSDLPPLDPDLHRTTHALIGALIAIKPAAVHCWMDEMGAAGGLAAAAAGVPRIIIDGRNLGPLWFETRGVASIRAAFRALVDRAIFVNNSEAGADDYRAWLSRPGMSIRVVRNGLDLVGLQDDLAVSEALRKQYAPNGGPLIGGMMRFAPEKRPSLWIDAAAVFARQRPDARFVLWGDGPLRKVMERRARGAGLGGMLAMPGLIGTRGAALGALDTLLLASAVEGTPNVALEAQSLGVPVVASDAGGVRETIAPALKDLVVRDATPDKLADGLERALKWSRESTLEVARPWVLQTYNSEAQRTLYRTLYAL